MNACMPRNARVVESCIICISCRPPIKTQNPKPKNARRRAPRRHRWRVHRARLPGRLSALEPRAREVPARGGAGGSVLGAGKARGQGLHAGPVGGGRAGQRGAQGLGLGHAPERRHLPRRLPPRLDRVRGERPRGHRQKDDMRCFHRLAYRRNHHLIIWQHRRRCPSSRSRAGRCLPSCPTTTSTRRSPYVSRWVLPDLARDPLSLHAIACSVFASFAHTVPLTP